MGVSHGEIDEQTKQDRYDILMQTQLTVTEEEGEIVFCIGDSCEKDAYSLQVTSEKCMIQAGNRRGLLYAVDTLLQLIEGDKIKGVDIKDEAFTDYRGVHFAIPDKDQLEFIKNMVKYVEKFRVADSISFDGITTAKGNFDISNTGAVSYAWACIGQHTDLVNPARFMTFMGAVADGGKAAVPYLVERVQCAGETTYEAKTQKTDRIMPQSVAETLTAYMRNNVQTVYGDWNFKGMKVCAKSGTGEVGGGKKPNAMFTGFVADEAYPLAFLVAVEDGGYGRAVCVPIIAQVLQACKVVLDGSQ